MCQVHQEGKRAAREIYRERIDDQAVAQLSQRHAVRRQHAWAGRKNLPDNRSLANHEP